MTAHGVDSSSLVQLRSRTVDALAELAELRSHDPAAAAAMRAIRLTRYTLDCFWLPALADLLSSQHEPGPTSQDRQVEYDEV